VLSDISTFFILYIYMSSSNYDFSAVRMIAKDVVDRIGIDDFYPKTNNKYPSAPQCSLLGSVKMFENFVLDCFKNSDLDIQLHNLMRDMGAGLCGMYVKKENQHYIVINSKLNLCWNRFTRLKELCSMYVDHYGYEDSQSQDYSQSLTKAFSEKNLINTSSKLDEGDLDSETFAILLACELIIPINERERIGQYFEQIEEGQLTYNDLAKSLIMPEYFLQIYHAKGLINKAPAYSDFNY